MDKLWNYYFDGKHTEVLAESLKYLANNHVADHLHITGLSLVSTGKVKEGKVMLLAASTLLPEQKHWFSNTSVALLDHDPEAALQVAETGLTFHPNSSELYFNKGNALNALKRADVALEAFDKSLSIEYRLDALLNKGNSLRRLERQLEALNCYDEILKQQPENKAAKLGKAVCLTDRGQVLAAEPLFKTILDVPEAAFLYGIIRLTKGDLKTGWHYYNQRWNCGFAKADADLYRKPIPKTLEEIKGKTVLLVHEQGNGDSLQFIRFLPMLRKHVKTVIVVVPQQLIRLFKRAYPDVDFINGRPADGYDYEIPMLNQPSLLDITLSNIPNRPYLSSEYLYLRHGRTRVGLCWAGGNATPNVNARRSMRLEHFLPLADLEADFVSLQLGDPAKELTDVEWKIEQPLKNSFDYLDTANVINTLDLVITVDTSVAHLAAAMGKPTWILSRYDACWRWLENREDSPWYPSVRIFRQPPPVNGDTFSRDWPSVIQKIKENLHQQLSQPLILKL